MREGSPSWHLYPGPETLAGALAAAIVRLARESIDRHGSFHMVLAGGNTPRTVYARIRQTGHQWERWHLYYSDERCVPRESPDRNSRMAEETWLAHVPVPVRQHHVIPAELGPGPGARAYAALLPSHRFDLVLLGLGEDGHCASLFPEGEWPLLEAPFHPAVLPVRWAPRPPGHRVSMGSMRLRHTRRMMFLVSGSEKTRAVHQWRAGERIPAAIVGAGAEIWLDEAAWTGADASGALF